MRKGAFGVISIIANGTSKKHVKEGFGEQNERFGHKPVLRSKRTILLAALMFENIRSDFRAHDCNWGAQGFWVMIVYRFGQWRYGVRPMLLRKLFSFVYKVLFKFIQIVTGIELPCEAIVGRNFVIDHFGGIIVSGYARFGDNCRIRNGVVVGLRRIEEHYAPAIGNNVDIGSGAKLLGRITIGDNSIIGANAVVLDDVPTNSIAVGVPAIVTPRRPNRPTNDKSNSQS